MAGKQLKLYLLFGRLAIHMLICKALWMVIGRLVFDAQLALRNRLLAVNTGSTTGRCIFNTRILRPCGFIT